MSKAPSMPMYWDAYLADTTHLTTEEHGAYLLLLAAMWRRDGSVPDNDKDNARILGLTLAKWRIMKERFVATISGFQTIDGSITQEKLQKTWDNTQEKIEKNRANGAKGGRPQSLKDNDLSKANGSVSENLTRSRPEPDPEPYPELKPQPESPSPSPSPSQPQCSGDASDTREPEHAHRHASSREVPTPPGGSTWREKLCEAMGLDPCAVRTGERTNGSQSDMFEADKWVNELGLSKMEILTEIRHVVASKADGPPATFKYFTPAMQRLAAAKAAPKLEPEGNHSYGPRNSQARGYADTDATNRAIAFAARAVRTPSEDSFGG